MPIYDYRCEHCGSEFETILKVDENVKVKCPECSLSTSSRVLSVLGAVKSFDAYYETNIDDKPVLVRTRQDLKDEINRHNDGELADKVGRLAIFN